MKNAPTTTTASQSAAHYSTLPDLLDAIILRHVTMQDGRASLWGIVQTCKSEGFEHADVIEAVDRLATTRKVRLSFDCDPNLGLFKRIRAIVELVGVQP